MWYQLLGSESNKLQHDFQKREVQTRITFTEERAMFCVKKWKINITEDANTMQNTFNFVIVRYPKFDVVTDHKRRPQSGEERVCQCGHFTDKGEGGSSDADVRTFCRKKTSDF